MKYSSFLVLFVGLYGCATSSKQLESDFQLVKTNQFGVVLSVDLKTNGFLREDKVCFLKIEDGLNSYELTLEKGLNDYALSFTTSQNKIEITQINCGPFYYYDLKNQGTAFSVSPQKVKYLGIINFKLQDKGKLEWGLSTKDKSELLKRAISMGFDEETIEVSLLDL